MRPPHAIGYIRVSTEAQADSGLGLEAQRSAIAGAAERLRLPLAAVHEDAGVSGSLPLEQRPGLLAAVAEIGRRDTLLVAKRDRLGRDVIGVAMIERLITRKGGRVVSAAGEGTESDDPTALLLRRIVDAFGEYERLLIGARTRAALRSKRLHGLRAGTVPFGYLVGRDGQTLTPCDPEQRVLHVIRECRKAGLSLREIATALNARGMTTRRGSPWRHQYVASLLADDRHTTVRSYATNSVQSQMLTGD